MSGYVELIDLIVSVQHSSVFPVLGRKILLDGQALVFMEREVLEETGIESKCESTVAFTRKHSYQFGKSNISFICRMTPLAQRINILDTAET
ncbi:hypothetical protein [Pseudomonas sp. LBUM920]|uniref:hypothetical protein n=1 Tax=Pseudomonas sp. LBUM920 TaxID=2126069 RepID=UPI000F6E0D8B|nr:hypothetical protein [Pseudomonas sp. LBUM920]AZF64118.1 MutT domain protein-like [Pseudomonas sp. LBUM920]